ncbi:MAG: lipid-A-disaccharide synthase [Deltaproteobacteria bacterium RIFCSPLOWO2_02_FULL_57_26]|nr:MAG: lipid-A-disaccharide synthase [Deltaproteobacteria bacterium RIFCSPLOWO2_02_FULL_57_26]OGQ82334.1 MAG: lipid-A-disaccharide synthase [Deltaproteobacteria bacterium RIFCSPLOWO2_12_FULL_57_22]
MVVVGEASGDLHGAQLVRSLCQRHTELEIFGVAGERLRQEGVRVIFDVARLTGMGLAELAGNLRTLWMAYRLVRGALRKEKPDLLILIDFPEFNLRLARLARRIKIPVLYYISPQVWAWRKRRVKQIARWVDHIAVVFPFEVAIYEKRGMRVSFVGHPLLDVVRSHQPRQATLAQLGLDPSRRTIALLPGSRRREIAYHLPPMLEAADRLSEEMEVQFVLVRASTVERGELERLLARSSTRLAIAEGNAYDVLNACDLAWAASGTATLETALMLKPMVIVYRLAWLTYALARLLVRVDHIGMVNIIAGQTVVPELIQNEVTPERILFETRRMLLDGELYRQIVEQLAAVRQKLGTPGAAERVADIALGMMG